MSRAEWPRAKIAASHGTSSPPSRTEAAERPVLAVANDVDDLRPVAHLGAPVEEVPPDVPQDDDEPVGPDVRLAVVEDRVGGAEAVERLEDDGDLVVPLAAGQLAVAEGPRAPLAELHVRLGVEVARLPEAHDRPVALLGRVAPLEDDERDARVGEGERGEEAGRPGADDGDARLPLERREEELRGAPRRRRLERERRLGRGGGLRRRGQLDGVLVDEVGLLPGVERAADDLDPRDRLGRDAEEAGEEGFVRRLRGADPDAREAVARHGRYSREVAAGPREIEAKFRVEDRAALEARLRALGARRGGLENEVNLLLDDDVLSLRRAAAPSACGP